MNATDKHSHAKCVYEVNSSKKKRIKTMVQKKGNKKITMAATEKNVYKYSLLK